MTTHLYKIRSVVGKIKNRISFPTRSKITAPLFLPELSDLHKTLLIVCSSTFDQRALNAETLMRLGFAAGWANKCGPAKLIPIYKLMKEIELNDNPAVFMSIYDFDRLTYAEAKRLRKVDLFVWVSIHPRTNKMYEQEVLGANETYDGEVWLGSYGKVVFAEPKFVWNAIGAGGMEWFQGWIDDGFRWETIYPAADTTRYFCELAPERFGHIQMAYVGGYWPEKAQGFDQYLRPWDDILYPFGYAKWPYKNYGGRLDERGERQLYSTARIIPLITSPFGWMMAEITERYLKAPACHAFCIADQNPAVREIFTSDEMLQAENPEHFHQLVRETLAGKIDCEAWAIKTNRAVLNSHTYAHRAIQIRQALVQPLLKLDSEVKKSVSAPK
jgi:hypothetical protein